MNLTKPIKGYIEYIMVLQMKTNGNHYKTGDRLAALDRLIPLLQYDFIHPKTILSRQEDLIKILPHDNNKKRPTLEKKINLIITTSKTITENATIPNDRNNRKHSEN